MLARLSFRPTLCLGLALSLGACAGNKEPNGPPIGQTRVEGALSREIEAPKSAQPVLEPPSTEAPLTREELNALAEEEALSRRAEWARSALAEVASPTNDLGVVVAVAQRASDLEWLLAIQNRGERPVSVAALPELLTFEVVPKERTVDPPPAPPANRWAKKPAPPPQIWCGVVPKDVGHESRLSLLPGEMLVFTFDPRSYCEDSDVLTLGATIKPRYGFPLETKKVWRKGKMVEETLPPKPPLAFEPGAAIEAPLAGAPAPASATATAEPTSETPAPVLLLKHVDAAAFVLDETYPLEQIAPLGRIETPASTQHAATASAPPPADPGTDASPEPAAARPPPPPPPPLTLTIRPLGSTGNPTFGTVTVSAKNTSGRPMRLFLRRELISYQVTGPSGPTTCRMTPGSRAPTASAYSSLGVGAALSLTTRLAEACPKGTFDLPGTYTVFARIDAQNDGREHGFIAFTGTAITQQPAALTVRGGGPQAKPAMRVVSGK